MRFRQPTGEQIAMWAEFLSGLPEPARRIAERFEPWELYRLKTTNQRVFILGVTDTTVSVGVTGEFNLLTFERKVVGVNPDDLTPCDLPGDDEPLGSLDLGIEEIMDLERMSLDERAILMRHLAATRPLRTYPRPRMVS